MQQNELIQPILSKEPEPGHRQEHVLPLSDFLKLLKEEEDYFQNEQENTSLMITRLRKIFYDKWGWDTQLIKKAAFIQGRYQVEVGDCPPSFIVGRMIKEVKRYKDNTYTPRCRLVTYRPNDRVYGNSRQGEIPEIYKFDHADVFLPEGYHGDIGHVLAGLDALYNPQPVSPLPVFLFFLYPLFPYAHSNADVATWLGDMATSSADFVFAYLKNGGKPLDIAKEQEIVNMNASASDMLGNIDSYVIHYFIQKKEFRSKRVSEILEEYYGINERGNYFRSRRYHVFAEKVGLGEWKNEKFSKEEEWLKKYENEFRSTVAFMIYHYITEPREKYCLPFKVWREKYENVIKVRLILTIFLEALKKVI